MSLGRARAMSQLAGEAVLLSWQTNKVPQPSVNGKKGTSWGVNGRCELTRPRCSHSHAKRTPNEAQNMRCTSRNVDVLSYSTT